MSDQEKTVTVEEFNALKAELETTKEAHGKLSKIFNERQTKTLDKEGILKTLGIEKDPTKDPLELINEKLTDFNKTIEQLQKDLKDKDEKLTLKEKQEKAKELAEKAGLKAKVVKFIDLSAEDLEAELKTFAEENPEFKNNKTLGGGGANPPGFPTSMINPYKAETLNLTKQYELEHANPSLAAKFKAEAGLK